MAGEQQYNRNYMLNATLKAEDNASAAFAEVGAKAQALEEQLKRLENSYEISITLVGEKEARREAGAIYRDLKEIEDRFEGEVGIRRDEKNWAEFRKDHEELKLFDDSEFEGKMGLDDTEFKAKSTSVKKTIEEIRSAKAQAKADFDIAQAMAKADTFENKLETIERITARAQAGVDVDDVQLNVLQTRLNALKRERANVLVTFEEHGADEAIAKVKQLDGQVANVQVALKHAQLDADIAASEAKLETLTAQVYNIQVGVDTETSELTALKAQLAAETQKVYSLRTRAVNENFPQAIAEIEALINRAESATDHVVAIRADVDALAAMGKLGALYALIQKVAGRYNIEFNVNSLAAAQAAMTGLVSTGSSVSNAFEQMGVSAGRITQAGNLLQSVLTLVLAALVALAVAAAGPIIAAFTILAATIVAVTGGLALLAAAAAPLIATMGASAGAAEKQAAAQEGLRNAGVAVEGAQRNLAKAQQGVADATEQAAQRVSDATVAYNDSLATVAKAEQNAGQAREEALKGAEQAIQQYNDSLDAVSQAEVAAGRAREEALKGVEQAIQQYNDSLDSVSQAERAAGDARVQAADNAKQAQESYKQAVAGVSDAERSLEQARQQVTQATESAVRAQEDLNRAMRDEPLNQAEAELNVKDAALNQAEATQRVAEAQQSLNEARKNPDATSTDISGAELALQRAQLGTEQSSLNAARAQNELSDIRANGSSELQSATDAEKAALQQQQDAYQGVYDAQGNLVDAQGEVVKAGENITKTQVEGARSIEDADRSLSKAREESNRAYLGIADAQEQGAQRVADADLALSKAQEQSSRAYLGIAEAQAEGARKVQDADEQLAKARQDSARAYDAIGRAQVEGDKQIASAQDQVVEAQARLADAQLDYAAKAAKAAAVTGDLTQLIKGLPPALQPLALAFVEAFAPATATIASLGPMINNVAMMALPALGVAAANMASQFVVSLTTIADAWNNNGVLTSMQTILNFIPSITGAFTEAFGNALGGLMNIFAAAMPFVQQFAFWVRDISLRFLEWSNSEGGRVALYNFFATVGPLASTIGYWVWEIAKAIVNWSVDNAAAVAQAVDYLGQGIWLVGSLIGPVVSWLLQFAVAHPYVLGVAIAIAAIGSALVALGTVLIGPIAAFTSLWSVVELVSTIFLGLGFTAVPALGLALAAIIAVLGSVVIAGMLVYDNWEQISAIASWLATNVPYYFQLIADFLAGSFTSQLSTIAQGILSILPAPFKYAADLIVQLWGMLPTWLTDTITGWLNGAWSFISDGILKALPAPFRYAIETILGLFSYFTQGASDGGWNAGEAFNTGWTTMLKDTLDKSFPILGYLLESATSVAEKVADALGTATSEASASVSANFEDMKVNSTTDLDELLAKSQADMEAQRADIEAKTTEAQTTASTQMAALQTNSGASLDSTLANAQTNMAGTFDTIDTNLYQSNVNGSDYLNSLDISGSGSTQSLNTNSVTSMGYANQGINANLLAARTGGEGTLASLRDNGSTIANEAFKLFTQPFWDTAVEVQNAFNAMIYGVGQIIDAIGLSMDKPTSFTVMQSSDQFVGSGGNSKGSRATGGVYSTEDSNLSLMAKGGHQAGVGGMADGKKPRVVYGEAGSPEAYIVKNRPTAEQAPYLKTAAAWHGMQMVPKSGTVGRDPHSTHEMTSQTNLGVRTKGNSSRAGTRVGLKARGGITFMEGGGVLNWDWAPEIADRVLDIEDQFPGIVGSSYYGHGEPGGGTPGVSNQYTADFTYPGTWGGQLDPGVAADLVNYALQNYGSDMLYYISQGQEEHSWWGSFGDPDGDHYDHVHITWADPYISGAGALTGAGNAGGQARMKQAISDYLPSSIMAPTDGAFASAGTMDQITQGTQQKVLTSVQEKMMSMAPRSTGIAGLAVGADIIEMIHSVFPEDAWSMAETVASRESGGDPTAYNASGASGIFQIMPSTAEAIGGDPSQLFDAAYNIALAAKLYGLQGWAPWTETAYDKGGVTQRPHVGLVGEGGHEAMLPLNNKRAMGQVRKGLGIPSGGAGDIPSVDVTDSNPLPVTDSALLEAIQGMGGTLGSMEDTGLADSDTLGAMNTTASDQADSLDTLNTTATDTLGSTQETTGNTAAANENLIKVVVNGQDVSDQFTTLNGETGYQSGQLDAMGQESAYQTGQLDAIGQNDLYQTDQLSAINNTGLYQSDQLAALNATDAYQTDQLAGLGMDTATQTGQLGGIGSEEVTQTDALQQMNGTLGAAVAIAGNAKAVSGPGGTTSTYSNRVGSPQQVNISSVANTGKAQGPGAKLNVPMGGGYNSATGGSAVPVSDVGTQKHLASQGTKLSQMQTQDALQNQKITQLSVDSTQQTGELNTIGGETAIQTDQMGTLQDETATQTGTLDTLSGETQSADQQIISLLTQQNDLASQANALLSQMVEGGIALSPESADQIAGGIGSGVDSRLASNPKTHSALDSADELRALKANFGG